MGGRAVECTGLENRQSRKRLVGSNPTPSVWACCKLRHLRCREQRKWLSGQGLAVTRGALCWLVGATAYCRGGAAETFAARLCCPCRPASMPAKERSSSSVGQCNPNGEISIRPRSASAADSSRELPLIEKTHFVATGKPGEDHWYVVPRPQSGISQGARPIFAG